MKKILGLIMALCYAGVLSAQLNMTLNATVTYGESLNDVWGWADPDNGREFALVGVRNGVSIYEVTDPDNPVEMGYANGPSTTWRDIKAWNGYAYVTNETGDGILVIDLTDLDNFSDNSYFYWAPDIDGVELSSCHNIFIDEFGIAYLAGCNVNNGGMLYVDVNDPGNPIYINKGPDIYAHDVYTRDNLMYSSEIYQGTMTIYDVSDKDNTTFLGNQTTPFNFTHNIWLSDDSNTAFTTDERADA
ncbi:MAG: choice-of-anchor B family protein, partial [Bacteroidota bacterium]